MYKDNIRKTLVVRDTVAICANIIIIIKGLGMEEDSISNLTVREFQDRLHDLISHFQDFEG